MTTPRHTVLAIAMAAASLGAFSQTDAEHTQHHAPEPAKKALSAPAAKSPSMPRETMGAMGAMDGQIKAMREMHEKMVAAKTPEERKALMADHMKTMQDGMSMMEKMDAMGGMPQMGDMKGTGKGQGPDAMKGGMSMDMMGAHKAMQKRMEMMTTMMRMMMDRLPSPPAQ